MSTMTLFDPPRRLRCQNPVDGMYAGSIYVADAVLTNVDGSKDFRLSDGRWYDANRFIDEDAVGAAAGIIDCGYEDPSLPERITPRASDVVFDFDHYNSLSALPGVRR